MSALYYFVPDYVFSKYYRKNIPAWKKTYDTIDSSIPLIDRTNGLVQPMATKVYDQCLLPVITESQLTYKQCLEKRSVELFEMSTKTNAPLSILWDGSISSTAIIISFLKSYHSGYLKKRIKILTNPDVLTNNDTFYKKYVLPNFEIVSEELLPQLSNTLIVTPEFNDHLFYDEDITDPILIKYAEESAARFNIQLADNKDIGWWFKFCFQWQHNHFKLHTILPGVTEPWSKQYIHHFYQTDYFQLWSIKNKKLRDTDKSPCKQYVYEFDNSLKCCSTKTDLYSYKPRALAITSKFETITKFNPDNFYNTDYVST